MLLMWLAGNLKSIFDPLPRAPPDDVPYSLAAQSVHERQLSERGDAFSVEAPDQAHLIDRHFSPRLGHEPAVLLPVAAPRVLDGVTRVG